MFKVGDIITGKTGVNYEFANFKITEMSTNKERANITCVFTENPVMWERGYKLYNIHLSDFIGNSTRLTYIKNSLNFIVSLVKS